MWFHVESLNPGFGAPKQPEPVSSGFTWSRLLSYRGRRKQPRRSTVPGFFVVHTIPIKVVTHKGIFCEGAILRVV